jgi:MFS family permease
VRGDIGVEQSQSLFDVATLITLAASLLVSAAAFAVMRFYLRAIFRESQRSASAPADRPRRREDDAPALRTSVGSLEIEVDRPVGAAASGLVRSPTFQRAEATFRRGAAVYLLAGSIHAATSVALLSALSSSSFASRSTLLASYAGQFWSWSFFTLIALALFCGPDRRIRASLIAVYIATLPALGALLQLAGGRPISFAELAEAEPLLKAEAGLLLPLAAAVTGSPVSPESVVFSPLTQPILFWALTGVPVLIPLLMFNRFVRGTVGPLFISLALMTALTTLVINDVWLNTSIGIWLLVHIKGVFGDSTLAVMTILSLMLAIVTAILGVLWIARRYRRNQLSDQTFLFDALWLSASFCVSAAREI